MVSGYYAKTSGKKAGKIAVCYVSIQAYIRQPQIVGNSLRFFASTGLIALLTRKSAANRPQSATQLNRYNPE